MLLSPEPRGTSSTRSRDAAVTLSNACNGSGEKNRTRPGRQRGFAPGSPLPPTGGGARGSQGWAGAGRGRGPGRKDSGGVGSVLGTGVPRRCVARGECAPAQPCGLRPRVGTRRKVNVSRTRARGQLSTLSSSVRIHTRPVSWTPTNCWHVDLSADGCRLGQLGNLSLRSQNLNSVFQASRQF